MTNLEIYRLYRRLFRTIDDNLDDLAKACQTHDQTVQLSEEWTQAEANYIAARKKVFKEDDPTVESLSGQLGSVTKAIDADLKSLKNIATTLDRITDAVHLGTALLSLSAAAIN